MKRFHKCKKAKSSTYFQSARAARPRSGRSPAILNRLGPCLFACARSPSLCASSSPSCLILIALLALLASSRRCPALLPSFSPRSPSCSSLFHASVHAPPPAPPPTTPPPLQTPHAPPLYTLPPHLCLHASASSSMPPLPSLPPPCIHACFWCDLVVPMI